MSNQLDSIADLPLETRHAIVRQWLDDLTTIYEQAAAERDRLKRALHDLRMTITQMRDSGHELPGSLLDETFRWEEETRKDAR